MSTYTFIRCEEDGGMSGSANHAAMQLAAVMRHRQMLDNFMASPISAVLAIRMEGYYDGDDPVAFIAKHQGHALHVEDEYGYHYDEQGMRIEGSNHA